MKLLGVKICVTVERRATACEECILQRLRENCDQWAWKERHRFCGMSSNGKVCRCEKQAASATAGLIAIDHPPRG